MTTFAPTDVRASEIARCERMAVLRAIGAAQQEHDEQTKRYFARGHLYSNYVYEQLCAKHGDDNIEREVIVQHPLGEGHIDIVVHPAKLIVEVKSSVLPSLSSPSWDMWLKQLRTYLHYWQKQHDDEEWTAALYVINPSDLSREDMYVVKLDDGDRAEIEVSMARVAQAIKTGELPERVCSKPGQARGRMCGFPGPCFNGWEPDPVADIDDPAVLDAASRLAAIAAEERVHRAAIDALEESKRAAKAELADVLPEKGETRVGPFLVRTWPVRGRVNVSAKALEAAGIDPYPFATVGEPRQEVRVEKADEAGDIDYGMEAPF